MYLNVFNIVSAHMRHSVIVISLALIQVPGFSGHTLESVSEVGLLSLESL